VAIEYRWAEGKNDRLPALAAELVHRQVAVIAATTTPAAIAARAATTTIPIVFEIGGDPVRLGLVSSLNRPGGNITGVTQLNVEVAPKRLELLHEVVGKISIIAFLVNPNEVFAETTHVEAAARKLGVQLHVLTASTEHDIDMAFANVVQLRAGGLVIGGGGFFVSRLTQLATLAARHAVPAVFANREFAAAGGLMSYGVSTSESHRIGGDYAGRILKGEKPGELPVQQGTKIEFFINLKSAKALGLTVPNMLVARADEVIE
jgi:putative ABC transport system substrate-binding protein